MRGLIVLERHKVNCKWLDAFACLLMKPGGCKDGNVSVCESECRLPLIECLHHRVHTEWQRPLSGVHSIMMEKLAYPLSLYSPSRTKLQCTLQLRGQIHLPLPFISTPMYALVYMNQPPLKIRKRLRDLWTNIPPANACVGPIRKKN